MFAMEVVGKRQPGQSNGSSGVYGSPYIVYSGYRTWTALRFFRIFYSLKWFFWVCQLVNIFGKCVCVCVVCSLVLTNSLRWRRLFNIPSTMSHQTTIGNAQHNKKWPINAWRNSVVAIYWLNCAHGKLKFEHYLLSHREDERESK